MSCSAFGASEPCDIASATSWYSRPVRSDCSAVRATYCAYHADHFPAHAAASAARSAARWSAAAAATDHPQRIAVARQDRDRDADGTMVAADERQVGGDDHAAVDVLK